MSIVVLNPLFFILIDHIGLMVKISTSGLAKKRGRNGAELFKGLEMAGWITREEKGWGLTDQGRALGGEYKESAQYGRYIVWPEKIDIPDGQGEMNGSKYLSATNVGEHYGFSNRRINAILSELGWIVKGLKGWEVTNQGKKQGGIQSENSKSGVPYVKWPEQILTSKSLQATIADLKGEKHAEPKPVEQCTESFREKFPAKFRATDGHMVRSKAEMLIDNWLYMAELVHAYERKLPISEDVYSDFYVPAGRVYIEYWGYENDPKYLARKAKKQQIYQTEGLSLIELNDEDVMNLDDILPRVLLKHGVKVSF